MLLEFLEELEVDVQIFRRRGRGICARVEIIGTDSVAIGHDVEFCRRLFRNNAV